MKPTLSLATLLSCLLWLVGAAHAEPFTVVVLPDTQNYSNRYPEIFDAQTQWIVENADAERIRFVSHVGDIVNNGPNLRQWRNASAAMGLLDAAGIPNSAAMGNHDNQYNDSEYQYPERWDAIDPRGLHYRRFFGAHRYRSEPWFLDRSPSGLSNFQIIAVDGRPYMFIHLEVDTRPPEIRWAQSILDQYPAIPTVIVTHRYLYDYRLVEGRFTRRIHNLFDPLYYENSVTATELFEQLIYPNPSVFMVLCGHVDGEYHQISHNVAGLPVYEILQDYQSYNEPGGNGWLRLFEFDEAAKRLRVRSYSPVVGRFRTNDDAFEATLEALADGIEELGEALELDAEQIERIIELTRTRVGRRQLYDWLYGDGQRDTAFELAVDFDAYRQPFDGSVQGTDEVTVSTDIR